ncbi:PREDICTED: prostatic spermine-binding protein [Tarenaya hassleriana]|uniref:prostatic spermine-binding protein n=1 Tax=Tarenaya hassleriana TaxID=28532 RepID=UPI00053C3BC0|nr:PREDICTED: prostatic spermine-binding protein [Tarenaya hassleriana]
MAVSLEALAMAGADYRQWGLDIEEWEDQDSDVDHVPPHLLADDDEEEQEEHDDHQPRDDEDGDRCDKDLDPVPDGRVTMAKAANDDCDIKALVGRAVIRFLKQLKL